MRSGGVRVCCVWSITEQRSVESTENICVCLSALALGLCCVHVHARVSVRICIDSHVYLWIYTPSTLCDWRRPVLKRCEWWRSHVSAKTVLFCCVCTAFGLYTLLACTMYVWNGNETKCGSICVSMCVCIYVVASTLCVGALCMLRDTWDELTERAQSNEHTNAANRVPTVSYIEIQWK